MDKLYRLFEQCFLNKKSYSSFKMSAANETSGPGFRYFDSTGYVLLQLGLESYLREGGF